MTQQTFPIHADLSQHAAAHLARLITQKPDALLCVASGDTPIESYQRFVDLVKTGSVDVSRCQFVGLDEWVGFGPDDAGSCSFYVFRNLFRPLGLRPDQLHLFDAKADDLRAECTRIDAVIDQHGGLDLLLVGMGMNGHLALNEPGTAFSEGCHMVELAGSTRTVGQKYFDQPTNLTRGITLGLRHLTAAHDVVLLVSGTQKASVLREALTGPVTEQLPASIVQTCPQAHVWVDAGAGSLM